MYWQPSKPQDVSYQLLDQKFRDNKLVNCLADSALILMGPRCRKYYKLPTNTKAFNLMIQTIAGNSGLHNTSLERTDNSTPIHNMNTEIYVQNTLCFCILFLRSSNIWNPAYCCQNTRIFETIDTSLATN
jgi:hypothetical protein